MRLGLLVGLLLGGLHVGLQIAVAQTSAPDSQREGRNRILLVLPFENRTGQPSLEWIREAAPEILVKRFASAGFAPMSRADRLYALDHLGLPQGFQPSRASALKLAQTLDADSIIVGSYITDGTGIIAEAYVVDVARLQMSPPIRARGEMIDLVSVFSSLTWKLTRQLEPGFSVAEETFTAAASGVRLDAFEQYIRGIIEPDHTERLARLKQATLLSPTFSRAWMAMGREQYASQQYEAAAAAFAHVAGNDPDALEAGFYRGVALLFFGDYAQAEAAFAAVARVLPLAEVLNNEGVAVSRRGHDGTTFFQLAEAADPNLADYHFNLAVSMRRHGQAARAQAELAQALRLHPTDLEAQALEAAWKQPVAAVGLALPAVNSKKPEEKSAVGSIAAKPPELQAKAGAAAVVPTGSGADPLERIQRSFNAVAFRQAALMVDEMQAERMRQLDPRARAKALAQQGKNYLDRGLLLEAERLYQNALAVDKTLAAAHAGVAEIRERTGDSEAARGEAQRSIELSPSVQAWLVLYRLDRAANHLDDAERDVAAALKLEPRNPTALELQRGILPRQQKPLVDKLVVEKPAPEKP